MLPSLTRICWHVGTTLWLALTGMILTLYSVGPSINESYSELSYVAAYDCNPDIYRLDVERNLAVNLTRHPGSDTFPAWSPDGRGSIYL